MGLTVFQDLDSSLAYRSEVDTGLKMEHKLPVTPLAGKKDRFDG